MKRNFRAGKFPEHIITKDMIREMTLTIDCAPGTPNYKEFSVTEGMLFQRVPDSFTPPLEYCDHLLKVNGKPVSSKNEMKKMIFDLAKTNKPHYLSFTIRRIISVHQIRESEVPKNAAILKPDDPDLSVKSNKGYVYYKIVLIYFPRSKLGINVKSYQNVVYVEGTENCWGSTTRRFLYLGDAILKVDDTEIYDVMTVQGAIRNGFHKNGTVSLIVERANQQLSSSFVRNVLNFSKDVDPHIPEDVVALCAKQLAHYEKNGFAEPIPIFRGYSKSYKSSGRVTVTKTVDIKRIRGELLFSGGLESCEKLKEIENAKLKNLK